MRPAGFRLETLERENNITEEKFEEVARGWSEALEIVIPQDLEEAINRQKGLCRVIIEDKERLVAELQNVNLHPNIENNQILVHFYPVKCNILPRLLITLCILGDQELRIRDDSYVKELKGQEEEQALLIERMEDQIKTMTTAYREELAQLEVRHEGKRQRKLSWIRYFLFFC